MSIASEISRLQTAKSNIKTAIEAKGVIVGAGTLDTYSAKIAEITASSTNESGSGNIKVAYYDFDGTLLWIHRVNIGDSITSYPISNPNHTDIGLTFQEWNWSISSLSNIQADIDVGAIYTTTDGKSHIYIECTVTSGNTVTMYFIKSVGSDTFTIEWGDGTSSTDSTNTTFNLSHTYANAGRYTVKVSITTGNGTYTFANSAANANFIKENIPVSKIYTGVKSYVTNTSFRNLLMKYITLHKDITRLFAQTIDSTYLSSILIYPTNVGYNDADIYFGQSSLKRVIYNATIQNSSTSICGGTPSLEKFIVPKSWTTFTVPNGMYNLESIIVNSLITNITMNVTNAYKLKEMVIMATTPPSLSSSEWAFYAHEDLAIYVPDASVADYQIATNWINIASKIKAISTRL